MFQIPQIESLRIGKDGCGFLKRDAVLIGVSSRLVSVPHEYIYVYTLINRENQTRSGGSSLWLLGGILVAVAEGGFVEDAAVGEGQRHEEASLFAAAQRPDHDGDFVAGLEAGGMPALAREVVGAVELDAPLVDGAVGVGDVELDPAVRIGPLKFLDHAHQGGFLGAVEHGEGMVRERRARRQAEKRAKKRELKLPH